LTLSIRSITETDGAISRKFVVAETSETPRSAGGDPVRVIVKRTIWKLAVSR
jgi:hypothetical protein